MPPSWPRAGFIVQGPVTELAAGARGRLVVTTPDTADAARVLKEQGIGDVVVTEGDGRSDGRNPGEGAG